LQYLFKNFFCIFHIFSLFPSIFSISFHYSICLFSLVFIKANWIVKRHGKYGRKVSEMWNDMENMAEIPVE
jgi:hypothetical protein